MTVDDISREHVRSVRVRVTKEVGKAHGWERVVIVERAFVKLDHDLNDGLVIGVLSWQMMKLFNSTLRGEAGILEIALMRGNGVHKRRCLTPKFTILVFDFQTRS